MTKSLTRLVSTVTLISALGLGAAFAQTPAPATGNAATTPAITAPAAGKGVDSKAKTGEHKAAKDHTHVGSHALKTDAAKIEKKSATDAHHASVQTSPKTDAKAVVTTPTVAPKS